MKEYNIYGGINFCLKYLYTGIYSNKEEAQKDARIAISHVENAYPKSRGILCYYGIPTNIDSKEREDLILNYIIEDNGCVS